MISRQCRYLQLIPLIVSFQIILCINHLLFNKINSSHRFSLYRFFLKWIAGTTISKCYGCQEKIQNPFKLAPDDLVMTNIFASLEILLLGYCDILMHLKMSISIYDQFVSEPDIPTSVTLGLMYHFKCSSLFRHCTFRDYYPSFIGAHEIHISYFWNFFQDYGFCLLSFHDHFYFSVKLFGL